MPCGPSADQGTARRELANPWLGRGRRGRLSAVGSPEDGLGEDRQHEPLLVQVLPRRPIKRVVLNKPRALQPPPSAGDPPAGLVVPVGVPPTHLSPSFGRSRRRGRRGGTLRVCSAVLAKATHDWLALCRQATTGPAYTGTKSLQTQDGHRSHRRRLPIPGTSSLSGI